MNNVELVELIKQGHKEYIETLYKSILPLIRYCIKRCGIDVKGEYINNHVYYGDEYEDMLQESYFALLKAINGFDVTKGIKFTTYATKVIIRHINRTRNQLPEHILVKAYRIRQTRAELMQSLQHTPTVQEIADKLHMDIKTIKYIENITKPYKSIFEPYGDGENEFTLGDTLQDDSINFTDDVEQQEIYNMLHEEINNLSEIQKQSIILNYFQGKTYKQIGELLGVSRTAIEQHIHKGIRNLRKPNITRKLNGGVVFRHVGIEEFERTRISSTEWEVFNRNN